MNFRLIAAVAALVLLAACTDKKGTYETLEDAGFKDIQITGHAWYACADSDATCTGFVATAPGTGRRVTGAVGGGFFFKGYTIRVTGRL